MNRKQFFEWLSTCPVEENGKNEGWFIADDSGYDLRIFFYLDGHDDDEELHEQTFTKSFFDEEMMETD